VHPEPHRTGDGGTRYGNPQCKNVTLEVFDYAILVTHDGEEDQVRQALYDAALATVVGEGEDRFDQTWAGAVQEVSQGYRRGSGEEVRLAGGAGARHADAQLL
jgi:hypothetical protein